MTAEKPDTNGKGLRAWVATWSSEVLALLLVAIVTYMATVVINNQRLTDRMDASEKDRAEIHAQLDKIAATQQLNSEFREASKVRLEMNQSDLAEIKRLVREHVEMEDKRWGKVRP